MLSAPPAFVLSQDQTLRGNHQGSIAPPSDPWSLSDAESWYENVKIRNRLRGRPALPGGRPSFESLSRGMSLSRCGPRGLAPGLAAPLRKRRGHILRTLSPHVNDFFKILGRFFSIKFSDSYFTCSEASSFAGFASGICSFSFQMPSQCPLCVLYLGLLPSFPCCSGARDSSYTNARS